MGISCVFVCVFTNQSIINIHKVINNKLAIIYLQIYTHNTDVLLHIDIYIIISKGRAAHYSLNTIADIYVVYCTL